MNTTQSGGRVDYWDYITSQRWYDKSAAALYLADYKCMVCYGNEALSVHHRTYERLGNELMTDLLVICQPCHNIFHRFRRLAPTPTENGREKSLNRS